MLAAPIDHHPFILRKFILIQNLRSQTFKEIHLSERKMENRKKEGKIDTI